MALPRITITCVDAGKTTLLEKLARYEYVNTPISESEDNADSILLGPGLFANRIREWPYGAAQKPETINYRTFKPEHSSLWDDGIDASALRSRARILSTVNKLFGTPPIATHRASIGLNGYLYMPRPHTMDKSTLLDIIDNLSPPLTVTSKETQLIPATLSYANFQQTLFAKIKKIQKENDYVVIEKNEITDPKSDTAGQCRMM